MKKFATLMLMVTLVGYSVGCSAEKKDMEPADSAPPADTGGDSGSDAKE